MPMNAAAEFFQCGDVAMTTNGVSWTIPRELPFAHDGFGQDVEWVAANFTNATEIAAVCRLRCRGSRISGPYIHPRGRSELSVGFPAAR